MDFERAILSGVESARINRKEGESEWHDNHPLFRYWWEAVNLKADWPDMPEQSIVQRIMKKLESK